MACISKKPIKDQYGFKNVPESLDEITAEWCEKVLKTEYIIASDTNVTSIDVNRFQNEETGVMDGGGFSGSNLVRVKLQYSGNLTGNEPSSMVCKLSLGTGYKIPILFRLFMYLQQGSYDEYLYRQQINFMKSAVPFLEGSGYQLPKIYFTGIDDKGDRGFTAAVILDKPTLVKCVILMEDIDGWRSSAVGKIVKKEEASLCLKNVAILHAKFWGDQGKGIKSLFNIAKPEKDLRAAAHSKLLARSHKRNFSSSEMIQKNIKKFLASDWKTSPFMTLQKDAILPDSFTASPLEDGSFPLFNDTMLLEMLSVLPSRVPNYNRTKLS